MEINKYQQAYQNVQAELPVDNEDIVILRELVEKSIPKMVDVTKPGLPYRAAYNFYCPTCGTFIAYTSDPELKNLSEYRYHCPCCGQRLRWDVWHLKQY